MELLVKVSFENKSLLNYICSLYKGKSAIITSEFNGMRQSFTVDKKTRAIKPKDWRKRAATRPQHHADLQVTPIVNERPELHFNT